MRGSVREEFDRDVTAALQAKKVHATCREGGGGGTAFLNVLKGTWSSVWAHDRAVFSGGGTSCAGGVTGCNQ